MRIFSQNNQPPDIDELLRKLQRFLADKRKQAGGKGANGESGDNGKGKGGKGGGDNEDAGFPMPPAPILATMVGTLLLLGYLLSGFFTVDANERVVMFRLGTPFDVRGPGLKWHMPLIESYRIVNMLEVRRVEIGYRNDTKNKNPRESLMLTGNLNIIDMQFVVQYALNDAELYLFENRFSNTRAEDVVQQVAETAMREVVGRNSIDFVLYEGREAVAEDTKVLMQDILDRYKAGIMVQQVAVQNVQPPDQVQDAFEDAIKARQDRERKINEGEAYANNILPRAQGQASRILKNAEAYKESAIVRAAGDTERFSLLAREYVAAPEITRRRLYLETVERVMSRARKVMIDDDIGSGNLLYLPLDKLINPGESIGGLPAGALPGAGLQQPGAGGAGGGAPQNISDFRNSLREQIQAGAERLRGQQ